MKASEKYQKIEINDTRRKIVELLWENDQLSAVKLAEKIDIANRNIETNIRKLKELVILVRHGSLKNGY